MSVRNVQRAREAVARIAIVLTVVIAIVGAVILTQRMSAESELFSLADRGDAQALKAAVTSGNVNAVDRWGSTALIRAAILGHDEACRVLLAAGADARRKDRKGFSALDYVNGTLRRTSPDEQKRTAEVLKRQGIHMPGGEPATTVSIDRGRLLRVKQLLEDATR